jgi:Zn-dependent peptidase ImmA (M78 family)
MASTNFKKADEFNDFVFPKAVGASKQNVQTFAASVAKELGYNSSQDIREFASKNLSIKIEYKGYSQFSEAEDASIFIDGIDDVTIILPDYTPLKRDVFSIAHEIGHLILHYPKTFPNLDGKMHAKRRGSNPVEWEANWFAAGFLMPEEDFCKEFKKLEGNPRLLAKHFGVSLAAATVRCHDLNLLIE